MTNGSASRPFTDESPAKTDQTRDTGKVGANVTLEDLLVDAGSPLTQPLPKLAMGGGTA